MLLVGCSDSDPAEQRGRLTVFESLPPHPPYVEGSLSFLRVVQLATKKVLVDGPRTDGTGVRGQDPLYSQPLPAGEYRLISYQRPCAGNCKNLDPPADRCSSVVRLNAGEKLSVRVLLGQRGGCTIRRF